MTKWIDYEKLSKEALIDKPPYRKCKCGNPNFYIYPMIEKGKKVT